MWGDGLEISSLLGEGKGEHSCCSKRESLASGREIGRGAQGPGEGTAAEASECTTLIKGSVFQLSNTVATSPVVTELLTCD